MPEPRLSPSASDSKALALERWQRIALGLRLAYNPWKPAVIAIWLGLGRRLALEGAMHESDMLQRSLRLLLQTASDPALPWLWRSACLEHSVRPLARWRSLVQTQDPLSALLWEQRFERAGQCLGATPRRQSACWLGAPR
ncbi:MAG: hypothetical protein J0L58_17995 [Burkholderiales bacterium]|nr:hypothetical protein [Burkholderiales bacterium]